MPQHRFILNFHGIGPPGRELTSGERSVWVEDAARFERILDFVKDENCCSLTFDDGNGSDYRIVFPALAARGLKAQFFVVAGNVDLPGYLSRDQVQSLRRAGMKIGSHGMRHRPWTALDRGDLEEELFQARGHLEHMAGVKVDEASCPFGQYNRRVIRSLRDAGYRRIYTSDGGEAEPGAFLVSRNSVQNTWDIAAVRTLLSDTPNTVRRTWRRMKLWVKRWR